jgi:hypothetical protein
VFCWLLSCFACEKKRKKKEKPEGLNNHSFVWGSFVSRQDKPASNYSRLKNPGQQPEASLV